MRFEEAIISKGRKPYARLMPLEPPPPRKGAWLAGRLGKRFWKPLPDEELAAWENEVLLGLGLK